MSIYNDLYSLLLEDLGFESEDQISEMYPCDYSPDLVGRHALARSFFKKLCPNGTNPTADAAALKKFLDINASLPDTEWDFCAQSEAESCFYDYFRNNLNRSLGDTTGSDVHITRCPDTETEIDYSNINLEFLRANVNVGPGSAQKAAQPMTMVSKLFEGPISYYGDYHNIALYRAMLTETGFWGEAEMQRFKAFGFVSVEGTKIFFAKKNAGISRTCGTESSLEMLFQKGIGEWTELRLKKHFGISLKLQPDYNRSMARIGSIDGSLATIDLISASDCIGLHMFSKVLDNCSFKEWVLRTRSKVAILPDGQTVELKMVSTMGNGFTFPLQTIIFASAVRAVYQLMGLPSTDPKTQFGVFGDDIIVRASAYDFTCRMLNKLGFKVNDEKSYGTGPFRESCGEDYFAGSNVRGVYVQSLETPQLVCSCINRLNRWSARTGIDLPLTLSFLHALVHGAPRVPPCEDDAAGIHVPFTSCLSSKVNNRYWFKYQYWKKIPRTEDLVEPDDSINPLGAGIGFLSGHYRRADNKMLSSGKSVFRAEEPFTQLAWEHPFGMNSLMITLRDRPDDTARYQIASSETPWWDYVGGRHDWKVVSYDRWKAVVAAQFN